VGLDQGLITAMVYTFYVLLQLVLLRKQFRLQDVFQIIIAFLFGYFVFFCNNLLSFPSSELYTLQLMMMALSIVVISLGILLYLVASLIPQPAEGLCLAIEKISGWKYHNIKTGFDCCAVALSALISFFVTGGISGIREGTLLAMIGVGRILGVFSKMFKSKLTAFCFPGSN
jgi:uncharacterized membrane protein YczE